MYFDGKSYTKTFNTKSPKNKESTKWFIKQSKNRAKTEQKQSKKNWRTLIFLNLVEEFIVGRLDEGTRSELEYGIWEMGFGDWS